MEININTTEVDNSISSSSTGVNILVSETSVSINESTISVDVSTPTQQSTINNTIISAEINANTAENIIIGIPGADGEDGGIDSIVAGSNITINDTDPRNPIISSSAAGDRYKTTSTTSQAIVSTGTLTFIVEAGLSYVAMQEVLIVYDAANHMHGSIVSYSGTSLVVDIAHKTGSGTYSSWAINLDGTPVDAITGLGSANQISYFSAAQVITSSANLTFDGNRTINFGDANNLASIGKNNTFTNGAAGSNGFMSGHNNTITLTSGQSVAGAFGVGNTAIGANAIAVGLNNTGSGRNIGRDNTSDGVGIGSQNSGAGLGIGSSNATGSNCYNLGFANDASGFESQSFGTYNYVRRSYSTAGGYGNVVDAPFVVAPPIALGVACEVYGSDSAAMGSYMLVNGARSMAMGWATSSVNLAANDTLRITYNGANNIDMTATKTVASVKFEVPDQTFSDSWNGDLSVPTKNAVYDKIITITDTYSTTYCGAL